MVNTSHDTVIVRNKQDIYALINNNETATKKTKFLLFAAFASFFVESYDIAGFGIAVPSLTKTFSLTAFETGALAASVGIGAFLAAVIGGYFVDRIGRLKLFYIDMICFVVAGILGAFAPSVGVLIFVRFLMGIGIGLDIPAAASFIAEYTGQKKKRGMLNNYMVWNYYALVAVYILGWILFELGVGNNLWRWMIGLGAIPALAVVIMRYIYMEESPAWLASRGEIHAAAQVLERTLDIRISVEPESFVATSKKNLLSFKDIFRPPFRERTIMTVGINFVQSIVYFSVGFYLPVITAMLFKNNFSTALIGTAVIQLFGLAGAIASVRLANRVGLRRETWIGFLAEIILLPFIGYSHSWLPGILGALVLAIFIMCHTFGPAGNGVSIAVLSYPTEIRGQATGFSYGIGRVGSVIGFFTFPLILASEGLGRTLEILSIAPLIGLIIIWKIRWDPTGKEMDNVTNKNSFTA